MEQEQMTIGIVGEGKMGTNIFYYLFDYPYPLIWKCHPGADVEKLRRNFDKKLRRSLESGILEKATGKARSERTLITNRDEDLAPCDLIIETVNEDRDIKSQVFKTLDPIVKKECIFTSNSSSINPSLLCPSDQRMQNFAGMHFFYPLALKITVELILPRSISETTIRKLKDFLASIKKVPMLQRESNSFILNRIYLDFQIEAYRIVMEKKITPAGVDDLVKERFFPGGVFCFFDSVGIDVMLASVNNYIRDYPHKDYYLPLIQDFQDKVDKGFLGQKSGKGFFNYLEESESKEPEPLPDPVLKEEIVQRLRHAMIAAIKRIAGRTGLPLDELRIFINDYFGVDWNLFP